MKHEVGQLIGEVVEKYEEWLEMSNEPECLLIEILGSLLLRTQEENKYLRKIAYTSTNLRGIHHDV